MPTLPLRGDYITLAQAVKAAGLADTGGQAKYRVRSGEFQVNGAVETPYTIASWFVTPEALLDGKTPAAWLRARRDPYRAVEAARRYAERLRH